MMLGADSRWTGRTVVSVLLSLCAGLGCGDDGGARNDGGGGNGSEPPLPRNLCGDDYLAAVPAGSCQERSQCPASPQPPFRRVFEVAVCDPSSEGADCTPAPLDSCVTARGLLLRVEPGTCDLNVLCGDGGSQDCRAYLDLYFQREGSYVVGWQAIERDACGDSTTVSEGEISSPGPCCGVEFEVQVLSDGTTLKLLVGVGWEDAS